MKIEKKWKDKSIEQLEKSVWPNLDSSDNSYLIRTCHLLRKKPLKEFTVEDLRILIGQNIGLTYTVEMAIEFLRDNILAEGDYYEGDLLNSVLTSDKTFWLKSQEKWSTICKLFENNEQTLKEFETTHEIRRMLFENFKDFRNIHFRTRV